MRDRETYDNYLDIPVSPEVREFLTENARELKRRKLRIWSLPGKP